MKLLFVTEQFPWPLNNGGNLRTFHILKGLATVHQVTLLSHRAREDPENANKTIRQLGVEVVALEEPSVMRRATGNLLRGDALRRPLWLIKNRSERIGRAVQNLERSQHFDAIHLNMLDTACFAREQVFACPVVFDSHNCLAYLAEQSARDHPRWWMRRVFERETRMLRRVEGKIAASVQSTLVCSSEDAERFRHLAQSETGVNDVRAVLIPNGVDLEDFAVDPSQSPKQSLVFVGAMDYFPNAQAANWFCQSVWPRIEGRLPDCRVYFTGKDPSSEVQRLARDRVVVTGRVPDVRPYIQESRVFIVPLKSGGGTRLKILTAMAAKRPIVSTSIGAEGLGLVDGEHLLIADSEQAFADAVVRLWHDEQLASRLVKNSYEEAVNTFSWDVIQNRLLSEYRHLIDGELARRPRDRAANRQGR